MHSCDDGTPDDAQHGPDPFTVRFQADAHGVRITLAGELDMASAPELDELLSELAQQGHPRLLIDLAGVTFMDSSGLTAIIRAVRNADAVGHRLTLSRVPPQVRRLMRLSGVLDRLTFEA